MNTATSPRPRHRTRGSAFVTVLLYSFLLLTLVATILQWSLNERRMNSRASYFMEARNAAEAVAEYGFSQIATEFSTKSSVPTFDPQGTSPLVLPPTSGSNNFFAGSNVDTAGYSSSHPTGLEVIGGTVDTVPSSGSLCYIDPNDPNNANDPLKGQYIYRRDIEVLARATVLPPNGATPTTAYIMEKVSVRGAPLFANAIFYTDNDLEISPGPQMDIYGPVHVNGNMFVSSQNDASNIGVYFHDAVSASGNIYHAWANENSAGEGSGGEHLKEDPVGFVNSSGTMIKMKTSATGYWRDSTLGADSSLFSNGMYINTTTPAITQLEAKLSSNFRQVAAQTWGGNLQTAAMGVADYNPVGAGGQVGVSGTTPIYANTDAADSLGYGPHAMIDPPNTSLSTSDTYYDAKEEVEKQKFANKASLYVQVAVTPGTNGAADTASIKLFGWPGSAPNGTPADQVGPNGGILLGTVPSGLVSFIPYKATQVTVGNKLSNNQYPITTTTYSSTTTTSATTYSASNPGNSQVVNSGLYDQREDAGINLVQVDMAALRAALNDTLAGTNGDGKAIKDTSNAVWGAGSSSGGYDPLLSGSTGWNGGIYFEINSTSTTSTTQTSVALSNGQVDSGNSLIPTVNNSGGLTIATNAPMYVLGVFNADGLNATSATSATTPDDGKTDALGTPTSAEVPAALASDAITILSPGYFGSAGSNGSAAPGTNPTGSPTNATKSWSTIKPAATDNTEVAAAFITGVVTTTDTAMSGGAHNLPRFLEDWSPSNPALSVTIRGSLVVLYHSKIATGLWSTSYYDPPTRNWGFDKIFKNGHFPPLTPRVMSYRRVDFTDYSPGKYGTERSRLWPSLP